MHPDPISAITIDLNVPVPMRDGTVLRADVYRPGRDGRFPVLVNRSPYDKNLLNDSLLDFKAAARAGYVLINQDTRGRFASDGEWMPWRHEREDGYDTVEWAASLPYSNGKVGMFGASYHGSTQWSAAMTRPPHLAAIAPTTTWSDPEDGLLFRGGAIEYGLNLQWGLLTAVGGQLKSSLPLDEKLEKVAGTMRDWGCLKDKGYWQLPAGAPAVLEATGQPDLGVTRALADSSSLDESRVGNRYDDISVPVLTIAGWYDVFLQGSLDNHAALRMRGGRARMVIGPWSHGSLASWPTGEVGEVNFGLGAMLPGGRTVTDIHLGWFDHWLKELPATEEHESGVLLFVMGANEWREEAEWPLSRATETSLYLMDDGSLAWDAPTSESQESAFVYDPADPVQTHGGTIVLAPGYPAGPLDQHMIESRDDVLVFTTSPLTHDIEISGRVRATLFAATDGPSTDWVVRLCEVDEQGVSRNIVDGVTRVRCEPLQVEEVEVDLWSTSILIRAGHRLRVHVTSSNFPRWDRNLNTGESVTESTTMRVARQRVFHDIDRPSRIVLPIVGRKGS